MKLTSTGIDFEQFTIELNLASFPTAVQLVAREKELLKMHELPCVVLHSHYLQDTGPPSNAYPLENKSSIYQMQPHIHPMQHHHAGTLPKNQYSANLFYF